MKKLLIGTLLVVGMLFVISVSNPERPTPVSAPTGPVYAIPPGATPEGIAAAQKKAPAKVKNTSADQAKRKRLIQTLMREGILYKIEGGNLWVASGFYRLPIDDKKIYVRLVAAYLYVESGQKNIVILKDSRTGKTIGTFSELTGLRLD